MSVPEYGVFVLDPGGSSGLAWARVRDEGTVAERLAAMTHFGTETVRDSDWMEQARQISSLWLSFASHCRRDHLRAYFVCEDFILRGLNSKRVALYPVWIAAAVVGYRNGLAEGYDTGGFGPAPSIETVWQQPGEAMTYATDERLKRWGLWIRGREHERDACRHLALFIANEKSQNLRRSASHMRIRVRDPIL